MGFGNLDGMFLFPYGRLFHDIMDVRGYLLLQCTVSTFDYVHFTSLFFLFSYLCSTYKAIRSNFFIFLLYVFGVEYSTCVLALSVYFYSLFFITGCGLFFFGSSCLVLCLYCYFRILYEGLAGFSYFFGCVFRAVLSSCFLFFCFDSMVYVAIVSCFLYFSFFPNYFCGFGCFGFVSFFIDYFSRDCVSIGFLSITGSIVIFNSLSFVRVFSGKGGHSSIDGFTLSLGFLLFFVNLILVFYSWYFVLYIEEFKLFITYNHEVLSYLMFFFIYFSLSVSYDSSLISRSFCFIKFRDYRFSYF